MPSRVTFPPLSALRNQGFLPSWEIAGDSALRLLFPLVLLTMALSLFVAVMTAFSGIGVETLIAFRLSDPGPKSGVRCFGVSKFAGAEIFRSDRSRVESKTPEIV